MASTTPLRQADGRPGDPQAPIAIDPEVILAGRAERLASGGAPDVARRSAERQDGHVPSLPPPSLDTTFRASHVDAEPEKRERSSFGKWALRFLATLLFAIASAVAAAAWQNYGDRAQELIARWTPRIALSSTTSSNNTPAPQPAVASADPAPQTTVTDQVTPAPATTNAPAAATPESAELLRSMARDVAALGQQVGDLKAAMAQLRASQEQMTHDVARLTETRAPEARAAEPKPFNPAAIAQTIHPKPKPPRTAAAPAAPGGTAPVRAPRPAPYPPTQTTAPATSPAQATLPPLQTAPVPVR